MVGLHHPVHAIGANLHIAVMWPLHWVVFRGKSAWKEECTVLEAGSQCIFAQPGTSAVARPPIALVRSRGLLHWHPPLASVVLSLINAAECLPTSCSFQASGRELFSASTNGSLVAAGGGDSILFWDRRKAQPLTSFGDTHAQVCSATVWAGAGCVIMEGLMDSEHWGAVAAVQAGRGVRFRGMERHWVVLRKESCRKMQGATSVCACPGRPAPATTFLFMCCPVMMGGWAARQCRMCPRSPSTLCTGTCWSAARRMGS